MQLGSATFKDSEGDYVVRELLPYIQPHDGILRVQLHRKKSATRDAEELRFIFTFRCGRCDHSMSEGVSAQLSMNAALARPEAAQRILDQVSEKLQEFCAGVRDCPCITNTELALFSEVITSLLQTLGDMSEGEFSQAVSAFEGELDIWNAKKVAKKLGFIGDDGVYRLPPDHPLNRQGGPRPTPRPPDG